MESTCDYRHAQKAAAGTDLTADVALTGLPSGLGYTAENHGDNDILITLYDAADTALTADAEISAVVKGSAVTESDALDSAGIALTLSFVPPDDEPTITLITTKAAGANIWLSIEAAPDDLAGVWIDLNGNDTKDTGEDVIGLNKKYTVASQDITIHGKVTKLGCPRCQLTSLDLSDTTYLVTLDCNDNQITSLDLSRNTAFTVTDMPQQSA